jgi:hypothetical protein
VALRDWVADWPEIPMKSAQRRAVDALGQTLDSFRPRALDRARSTVSVLGGEDQDELEEDRKGDGIAVVLRHAADPESTVEVDTWPDQALIRWLGESHNTRDHCGDAVDGEWPIYAAEVVADILCGTSRSRTPTGGDAGQEPACSMSETQRIPNVSGRALGRPCGGSS